ncbi:hypothetical protein BEH94_04295 [Candidatus Altiarchaeales archaeon WOR_SM1_SCG]|nr:hypothetical protein BEH94_04295 [Candidatus Altiarchaeales archaeon WOR_SM1_SCG]
MNTTALFFIGFAVFLYVVCYFVAPAKAVEGLKASWGMFTDPRIGLIPLILAAILIAGLLQAAIPAEAIAKYLGKESGFKGLFLGSVLGAVMPGGPYVSFPIAGALFKSGASVGVIIAFVSAWSLIALSRIPLEIPFLGKEIVIVKILASLPFSVIIGFLGEKIYYLFFIK